MSDCGSGVIIGVDNDRCTIATCWHLIREGQGTLVVLVRGVERTADLVAMDAANDLLVLTVVRPPSDVRVCPMRETMATAGEICFAAGFGPRPFQYAYRRGTVCSTSTTSGSMVVTGAAREGDSGGGVTDGQGRLLAILWATDGANTLATTVERLRALLANTNAVIGDGRIQPAAIAPPVDKEDPPAMESREGPTPSADAPTVIGHPPVAAAVDHQDTASAIDWRAALARGVEIGVPIALAAAGFGSVPVGAAVAWKLFKVLWSRRHKESEANTSSTRAAVLPLQDEYARQLAAVHEMSGRSTAADALLGREYDRELEEAEQSSDGALAAWAKTLRKRVMEKYGRVLATSPVPADSVDAAR